MTDESAELPAFSDDEILARVRAVAQSRRGFQHSRQGDGDLLKYDYDLEEVNELLAGCGLKQLHDHKVSRHYPEFYEYIAEFKIDVDDELHPFYVKVALYLPDLDAGVLMSFHWWSFLRL